MNATVSRVKQSAALFPSHTTVAASLQDLLHIPQMWGLQTGQHGSGGHENNTLGGRIKGKGCASTLIEITYGEIKPAIGSWPRRVYRVGHGILFGTSMAGLCRICVGLGTNWSRKVYTQGERGDAKSWLFENSELSCAVSGGTAGLK